MSLAFTSGIGDSSYYLSLGMGRFDSFKSAGYSWAATDLKLYSAAGVQNNLVPNASFEDSNVNFWTAGGAVASDPGKHGSSVWNITSTTTSYISLPVIVGQEYTYSFWSASPTIGNGHKIELGFSLPQNGIASGEGNTVFSLSKGAGAVGWTEYSGTFIPTEGQTTWYLGGMANGGSLRFDSVYLAPVPEPHCYLLLAAGAALPLLMRRRARYNFLS